MRSELREMLTILLEPDASARLPIPRCAQIDEHLHSVVI
jgi:hypothetical protein